MLQRHFIFHLNAHWRINYLVCIRICESVTKVIAFMGAETGWHNQQRTQNHLHYGLYKTSVSTSQRTQKFSITKTYQLLLFGKIKAHSFSSHAQYVSTMWPHVEFLTSLQLVRVFVVEF